jgi:hypothetical protein
MSIARASLAAVTAALLASVPLHAQFVTGTSSIPSGATVIDFHQFTGWTFTAGPIQVSTNAAEGVTYTAQASYSVLGNGGYGIGSNGTWSGRSGFGTNSNGSEWVDFHFDAGPVSFVGLQMNYLPGIGPVLLQALGAGGNILASYDVSVLAPINSPNGLNYSEFRGINRAQADIASLRISGGYAIGDDLTFARVTATPEPGTIVLMGTGLVAIAGGVIRRRRPVAS